MFDDALRLTIDRVFDTKYSEECIDKDGKYIKYNIYILITNITHKFKNIFVIIKSF